MLTVCKESMCAGCMACVASCAKGAISFMDDMRSLNCVIDEDKCIKCGRCQRICPSNNEINKNKPFIIKQGWADDRFRSVSSSGGFASAIMESFMKAGGFVCSCIFDSGEFKFFTTNDEKMIPIFAGSKYVKTNPIDAYPNIERLLKEKHKVLFVGLPCQSAAVQSYFKSDTNLYTIDLICHGTPSKSLLEKYLSETGCEIADLKDIKFRNKEKFGIYKNKDKLLPGRIEDSYLKMFLNSVDYTENCYNCKYATLDRVSDITLGDAWGQLSETTDEGVSLILCQTEKGKELIEMAKLELIDVDVDKAISANHQLQRPSHKHPKRETFLSSIEKGHTFRYATFLVEPKWSIKQSIKYMLVKLKILPDLPGGGYRLIVIRK